MKARDEAKTGRRRRPGWREALLVLASLLVVFLFGEVAFRVGAFLQNRGLLDSALARGVEIPADGRVELGHMIRRAADPRLVYELKPNLSVVYQGARVTTDARGFRVSPSAPAPPSAGAFRIVGTGDSFMFGQGVDDASTYLAQIGARLTELSPERAFEVTNLAAPGYNTVMEVAALRAHGLALEPDLVIIEFVGNDLSLPNFVREPSRPWSLRRSFVGDFVKQNLGLRRDTSLWRRLLDAGLRGVPQEDAATLDEADGLSVPAEYRALVGWDAYAWALAELRSLSSAHGFGVLSISLDPDGPELETRALDLARDIGFCVLDVGEHLRAYLDANGFEDYLGSPLALRPTDPHPSALAHRIAARAIAEFVAKNMLQLSGADEQRQLCGGRERGLAALQL